MITRLEYENKIDRAWYSRLRLLGPALSRPSTAATALLAMTVLEVLRNLPIALFGVIGIFDDLIANLILFCGPWYVVTRILESKSTTSFKVLKCCIAAPATLYSTILLSRIGLDIATVRVYGWFSHSSQLALTHMMIIAACICAFATVRTAEIIMTAVTRHRSG